METLILDSADVRDLIRHRQKCGGDRYDEVWDGVYVMAPIANNEHQSFSTRISVAISNGLRIPDDGLVFAGCNVSDREVKWTKNFRCPDVAVFLAENRAKDCGEFWFGGPDFAVEIVSPRDRSRAKLDFYFTVGVRELLIVDRKPWKLELYRNDGQSLVLAGTCTAKKSKAIVSKVIPFRFALAAEVPRPRLLVTCTTDGVTTRI